MKNILNFKTMLLKTSALTCIAYCISCGGGQKSEYNKNVVAEYKETPIDTSDVKKETKFLVKASEINSEEILLGKLAQEKSTSQMVKELGKMMEGDHTKGLEELTALAAKKSILLPATTNKNAQDTYKKLNELSEKKFDKTYCDMMVSGHKDAIALFEKDTAVLSDLEIKEWATITLPILNKHLNHAILCQKECEKIK